MDDGSGITRRSFLGGVALACGAAGLVMGFPRFALAEASEDELARSGVPYLTSWVGSDVYNTNQLITTNYFRSSEWVVIASGAESSWPDAIVASGVAGMKSAPVVLTPGSGLCEDAEISIRALGAKNAYIIGGTAVISQSVENRLHSIFGPDGQVIRLAGSTCYETAEQAYAAFKAGEWSNGKPSGNWRDQGGKRVAILAHVNSFHDGMCAGSVSYEAHYPILFVTSSGSFTQTTQSILKNGGFDEIYGIGSVAQATLDEAKSLSKATVARRLAGATSCDTSALVFETATKTDKISFTHVAIVSTDNVYDSRSVFGVQHGIFLACENKTSTTYSFMRSTGWMCDGIMFVGPLSHDTCSIAESGWWDGRINGGN